MALRKRGLFIWNQDSLKVYISSNIPFLQFDTMEAILYYPCDLVLFGVYLFIFFFFSVCGDKTPAFQKQFTFLHGRLMEHHRSMIILAYISYW